MRHKKRRAVRQIIPMVVLLSSATQKDMVESYQLGVKIHMVKAEPAVGPPTPTGPPIA